MRNCSTSCFSDYLVQCSDHVQVNAQLDPLTQYSWIIRDKFEKEYSGNATTDEFGFFQIPVADLPAGLLTEYSGDFLLQVLRSEDCKPVKFKVAQEYDCINFHIRGGTREKNNLGCNFDCVMGEGQGLNTMVPFTDASTLSIPWSEQLNNLYGNAPDVDVYHLISPGVYEIANVSIQIEVNAYDQITSIEIDNGGPATGYVLISA